MKKVSNFILFLMIVILIPSLSSAVPPQPARIGGTVTFNNRVLNQSTDSRLIIKVTNLNGTALVPVAEDTDGLNTYNNYDLDISIYDETQPGGVAPGTTVVIHVYWGSKELTVLSPVNGRITVGASASLTTVNISAEGAIGSVVPILNLLLE